MHRLSGGRILVFPTASGEPEEVGIETVQVFRSYGFEAELSPVFGPHAGGGGADPVNAAQVALFGSVYFTGGNQATIVETLAPEGWRAPCSPPSALPMRKAGWWRGRAPARP